MWNIPNILTMARAVATVPVAALALSGAWLAAFLLFAAAALTDFLDGWLARRWNQTSDFGRFLDPIADKLMVAAVLVALVAAGTLTGAEVWLVIAVLVREFLVAGLREYLGPRGIVVHVSGLAKWKTTVQLVAVGALLLAGALPELAGVSVARMGEALLWAATALTVLSGAQYLAGGMRHMARP